MRHWLSLLTVLATLLTSVNGACKTHPLHVLAFWSTNVESDHVDFAKQALTFYSDLAKKDAFDFQSSTSWDDLAPARLNDVQLVLWLNDFPHTEQQRRAFEAYMQNGGGWLGFHIAAYNDADTHWPWFVSFLGGGVFYGNNWPPLPASLDVDDKATPVTKHLPEHFESPANEWYIWKPSPRLNKDVKVLLTLNPSNYPLGFKDTITGGDLPVVWTNTRYKMIYINMGHGDKIFTSPVQNRLFEDALLWLGKHN
jgi:type 1 glutamine amidotransferase